MGMTKCVSIITIIFFFLIHSSYAQMDERLIGEWELIKIEKHNQTLIPEQGKYNLIITKTSIRYNLEVNSC